MSSTLLDSYVASDTVAEPRAFRMERCPLPRVEEAYRSRRVPTQDGSSVPMDVFIPREQGDYLYSLVRHLQPETTIEVGMANGLSTAFIAQALFDNAKGRHIAIDPFQHSDWKGAGLALLQQSGLLELVELREMCSHQSLPEMERMGVRAQFAFIDGSHLFDYVLTDFLCVDRILDIGGLIAFDDSDWPSVTQVLRYVLSNRHYEVAYPHIVIEQAHFAPKLASRMVRSIGKLVPPIGAKLRADFTDPSYEIGIRGRCVVLCKRAHDDRDSQSHFHHAF